MRRKDKEITERGEIDDILYHNNVCHLAMVDGDQPYVVPLTYGYDGRSLYIHSAREGRKIDVLRANDRVCFEVSCDFRPAEAGEVCRRSTKYRSVIGTGRASLIEDEKRTIAALDVLMNQTYGPGKWDYEGAAVNDILIIRIDIETLSGKRSGK